MTNERNFDDFSFGNSVRVEETPEHRTYEVLALREFQRLLVESDEARNDVPGLTVGYQPITVRTKGNVFVAVSGSGDNEIVREIVVQDTRQHLLEASYEFRSQGLLIEDAEGSEDADFPRCVLKLDGSGIVLGEYETVSEAVEVAEAYIEGLDADLPVRSLEGLHEAVLLYDAA